jgi:hypothetical protein
MQTVLARFRLGHRQEIERQAFRGVQRGIALGMHLDGAAEHTAPPLGQPRRVSTIDRERGDAANRWGFFAHAGLLLGTGHGPAVERV